MSRPNKLLFNPISDALTIVLAIYFIVFSLLIFCKNIFILTLLLKYLISAKIKEIFTLFANISYNKTNIDYFSIITDASLLSFFVPYVGQCNFKVNNSSNIVLDETSKNLNVCSS